MSQNKEAARIAFVSAKKEIDELLKVMQELSENHFNADPEQLNWAIVGSLHHIKEKLNEISYFALNKE